MHKYGRLPATGCTRVLLRVLLRVHAESHFEPLGPVVITCVVQSWGQTLRRRAWL